MLVDGMISWRWSGTSCVIGESRPQCHILVIDSIYICDVPMSLRDGVDSAVLHIDMLG